MVCPCADQGVGWRVVAGWVAGGRGVVVVGSCHHYGTAQVAGRARRTLREAKKEGKEDEREELKSSGC
eukprot:COSAG02_NODE_6177_length_3750_cov_5.248973_2_plen_68_part_00